MPRNPLPVPAALRPSVVPEMPRLALRPDEAARKQPAAQPPNRIQTATERFPLFDGPALDALDCRVEYLIHNVLVAGQPCIVAGPKKSLKTSILIDAALSLASGTPFLGSFSVPSARRVLLMSGESGEGTIQETARRIAAVKGISLANLPGLHVAFNLPQLGDHMDVIRLEELTIRGGFDVVILDPMYLAMSGLDDAGNLFQVGKLLWPLTEVGRRTGTTIVLAHHTKKNLGAPYEPPELGDIAWSGFAEWARQWVLLNRRGPYDPESGGAHHLWLSVGGSAGHGGAWSLDISEGQRTDVGGRYWSLGLGSAREERASREEHRATARDDRKAEQAARQLQADTEKLLKAVGAFPDGETCRAIRDRAGLSGTRAGPAFEHLEEVGLTKRIEVSKGGRSHGGFKPTSVQRDSPGPTGTIPDMSHRDTGTGSSPLYRGCPTMSHDLLGTSSGDNRKDIGTA